MENLKKSILGKRSAAALTLVIAIFSTLVACEKKGDSAAVPVNPYAYGTCTNCTAFSQVEVARGSTVGIALKSNLQVLGDATAWQAAQGYNNPSMGYAGPVILRGGLTVSALYGYQDCALPAGQYTLNTLQQGMKQSQGEFQFPLVEAVNGTTRILMSMHFFTTGTLGSQSMVGEYTVQSVSNNGYVQNCGGRVFGTQE